MLIWFQFGIALATLFAPGAGQWHGATVRYQWRSCPINGGTYLNGIAIDPRQPNVVYVFSDIGGVFKSTDYGDHWRIINRGLIEIHTHHSVATLAFHPRNPNVLYIGVGCNFGREKPQPPRGTGGVFISRDGGEHWDLLSADIRFCGHGITRQEGNVLAIDPKNPNVMYAGTAYEGIFKSTDGGRTWRYLALRNHFITTVALSPNDARTIYVAVAKAYEGKPFESRGGIYKSINGGETWQALIEGVNVNALVVHPTNGNVLYAACWERGVLKSTDGGKSWHPVNKGLIPGHGNRRFKAIAISRTNPNILFTSSSETDYRPPVTRFTNLYKSEDGGASWHKVPEDIWRDCSSAEGEYCYPGAVNWWGFFPNKSSIAIDPQNPNRVYYASGFGIWRSDDGGRTWRAKSRNLETASVNALVAHPVKSGTLYVGYGERGVFKSEDAGRTMKHLPVSIGFPSSIAIGVDASKRTIIYAGGEGHIWRSDDDGSRWTKLLSIKGGAVAIGIFARNPNIVYTAISGVPYMYVSTDGGVTWRKWKVDIIEPTAVVVHPTSPQVVYIRDRKRGVFKSSDGGRTWQRCNHGLPQTDHNFSRAPLAIDINDPRRLYTGYIDGLFASDDGGKSWRCIFGKIFAKGIAIDVRTSAIYVTNGAHLWRGWWVEGAPPPGVYRSDDGGRTWVRLSDDGLVNPELGLIALDCAFNGTVYVGTIGNGVFAGERMAR